MTKKEKMLWGNTSTLTPPVDVTVELKGTTVAQVGEQVVPLQPGASLLLIALNWPGSALHGSSRPMVHEYLCVNE